MAEATSFRNNALPYPVYGVAFTVVFPLLDADGDPVSPSSPDSEVSKNGDTFADCTNEATEIATSSGVCYLLLTAAEMTADIVTVQIKSTGAKTTVITLYPRKLPILSTGTCQGANDTGDIQLASGDSAVDDIYNGCLVVAVIDTVTEARVINDYVGSTKTAEVSPAWNTAAPDSNDTYTIYMPEGRGGLLTASNAIQWNSLATVELPLVPTTAGRKLDVSTGGEAGIDWANVGTPTTSLALTGTTIAVTQKVDVETIKTNPVVNAGTITFPTTATLASTTNITAGTITTTTNVTTVNGLAANVITAASIQADAITAAKIADGAIDAATFAADVDAEILSYIVDDATRIDASALNLVSGTTIPAIGANQGTMMTDLDDIQARLPAALVGGRIDATVDGTGMESGAINAMIEAMFTFDATATYATADAGSLVKQIADNAGGSALSEAGIADAVWDEAIAGHAGAGSTGAALSAAGSAGDPWITALPGAYGAGSAGFILGTNINATVSSRSSQTSVDDIPTNAELATALGTADDATIAAIASLNTLVLDVPTNAELATALAAADDPVLSAVASLNTLVLDLPTNAELATSQAAADDATLAEIALVKAKTDLIPASPAAVGSAMTLTSGERDSIAAALLDLANGIETGVTPRQSLRAIAAVLAGLVADAGSGTETYKGIGQAAGGTTRVTGTVNGSGVRSAVGLNL